MDLLADASDHVWLGDRRAALSRSGARAYLDDGRAVVWSPVAIGGRRIAVDAERRRTPPGDVAELLSQKDDFWGAWTRLEVRCKLTDIPVVIALRRPAVADAIAHRGIRTVTFDIDDVVVSCGVRVTTSEPGSPAAGGR